MHELISHFFQPELHSEIHKHVVMLLQAKASSIDFIALVVKGCVFVSFFAVRRVMRAQS